MPPHFRANALAPPLARPVYYAPRTTAMRGFIVQQADPVSWLDFRSSSYTDLIRDRLSFHGANPLIGLFA